MVAEYVAMLKEDPKGYVPQYMYHVNDSGGKVEMKAMAAAEHWPASSFTLLVAFSDGGRCETTCSVQRGKGGRRVSNTR